jgi:hypothetical protein
MFTAAMVLASGAAAVACGLTITGSDGENDTAPPPPDNGSSSGNSSSGTSGGAVEDDGSVVAPPPSDPADASSSLDGAPPSDAAGTVDADSAAPPVSFGMQCPVGTVYDDDFSTNPFAGPTPRWTRVAAEWTWNAANKSITVSNLNPHGVIWIGPRPNWRNYSVEVTQTGTAPAVPTDHGDVGPIFRVSNVGTGTPPPNNAGAMYLAASSFQSGFDMLFGRFEGGNWNERATASPFNVSGKITIRADAEGSNIRVFLGTATTPSITMSDNTYTTGSVGIRSYRAGVVIHRVKVTCR